MKKQLVVNADDLGLAESVNRAILDSFRTGIVTSASLMVNGAALDGALDVVRAEPDLDVGLHLALVDAPPLSPPETIPSLLARDGRLVGHYRKLVARLALGRAAYAEIETELQSQFEKILSLGIQPSHVDSHQHVHVWPGLLEVVIRLCKQYGIQYVRCLTEPCFTNWSRLSRVLLSLPVSFPLRRLSLRAKARVEAAGLRTSDHFFGFVDRSGLTEAVVRRIIESMPPGVGELMCHPGYASPELRASDPRGDNREMDFEALTSSSVKEALERCDVELTTYAHATGR